MREDDGERAAKHGRSSEFLRGVDADEDVHAEEDGISHEPEKCGIRRRGKRRKSLERDVQKPRDDAAGNEGRNQRDEDVGDALQEKLGGRCIPLPYGFMQCFAVADSRVLCGLTYGRRICSIASGSGVRRRHFCRRGCSFLFKQFLEARCHGGGAAGTEDDLQLSPARMRAQYAVERLDLLREIGHLLFELKAQARHAVCRLADIGGRADEAEDLFCKRFGFHENPPLRACLI